MNNMLGNPAAEPEPEKPAVTPKPEIAYDDFAKPI
jgi:hypothetical protein